MAMAKKLDYEYCKAAPMLEWLGNKWALSQVLRQLASDGIIRRELFPDVPPRTEYSVTDLGKTLLPHVEALINWGRENFDQIMSNRQNILS